VDGHNGIEDVVLAGKQRLGLKLFDHFVEIVEFALQIAGDGLAFTREFEISGNIIGAALEFRLLGDRFLQPPPFAQNALRLLLIVPEIRVSDLLFDLRERAFQTGSVKDTPAGRGLCRELGCR